MLPGWRFDAILPKLAEKAVEYIGQRAAEGKPFFLYFPLTSPHEPIAPSPRFQGKSGISALADFMMETDWAAGEVLQALDRHGLAANTLVFFATDNGHAPYTGLPELQQHGHEPSGPWRGYKADIWEGGHRIPFIARWPGKIQPNTVCDDTICLNNLLATCADILGATLPDDAGEDSFSILGPLCGRTPDKPSHEAVVDHSGGGIFAIRRGPWKLIEESGPATAGQLYNLQTDPAEKENLYDKHPDIVAELGALLTQYKTSGRSRPVRRPS